MQQDFARSRTNMVENQVRTNDVTDLHVQDSMRVVPRERFCAPARAHLAYAEAAAEYAPGWFLAEPRDVSKLLQAVRPRPEERVLAIAAPYAAAVMARIGCRVIARQPEGAAYDAVRAALEAAGAAVECGDLLNLGDEGPFDVIVCEGGLPRAPWPGRTRSRWAGAWACSSARARWARRGFTSRRRTGRSPGASCSTPRPTSCRASRPSPPSASSGRAGAGRGGSPDDAHARPPRPPRRRRRRLRGHGGLRLGGAPLRDALALGLGLARQPPRRGRRRRLRPQAVGAQRPVRRGVRLSRRAAVLGGRGARPALALVGGGRGERLRRDVRGGARRSRPPALAVPLRAQARLRQAPGAGAPAAPRGARPRRGRELRLPLRPRGAQAEGAHARPGFGRGGDRGGGARGDRGAGRAA